jgi:2-methylfumaryl-CoA isomerase
MLLWNCSALQREPARRAPILAEHTDEILLDTLGLGEGEIARHDDAVVAGPERSGHHDPVD